MLGVYLNSFTQLVLDNLSIVFMEITSYTCTLLVLLHVNSSPKRTQIFYGTAFVYNILLLALGQIDSETTTTWYGQAIVSLSKHFLIRVE